MDDIQIQSFEALRDYLRRFTNFGGDGGPPYDQNGVLILLRALVDNLIANGGIEPEYAETITLEFPTKSGHGVKGYWDCSYSAGDW
jgi:hypothetical protein